MKLLSIIVPVFNTESYLDVCIQSILSQTFRDFELILVNDGSYDNSAEICEKYRNQDNRIVVIHQKNAGVSEARNAGLSICTGKYIGFVDSDDSIELDMYELLYKNIVNTGSDVSICGIKRVFKDKVQLYYGSNSYKIYNHDEAITGFLNGSFLASIYDKIYKAEIAKSVRFVGHLYEDIYYNFLIFAKTKKTVFNDVIKYNYMVRDNSHSMASFNVKYMETLAVSKKILQECMYKMSKHIDESKTFDFNANIVVLNMILVASKDHHLKEYDEVVQNLISYDHFYKKSKTFNRYKYGYALFKTSPKLYQMILKAYSYYTNSEHLYRKRKSNNNSVL